MFQKPTGWGNCLLCHTKHINGNELNGQNAEFPNFRAGAIFYNSCAVGGSSTVVTLHTTGLTFKGRAFWSHCTFYHQQWFIGLQIYTRLVLFHYR